MRIKYTSLYLVTTPPEELPSSYARRLRSAILRFGDLPRAILGGHKPPKSRALPLSKRRPPRNPQKRAQSVIKSILKKQPDRGEIKLFRPEVTVKIIGKYRYTEYRSDISFIVGFNVTAYSILRYAITRHTHGAFRTFIYEIASGDSAYGKNVWLSTAYGDASIAEEYLTVLLAKIESYSSVIVRVREHV